MEVVLPVEAPPALGEALAAIAEDAIGRPMTAETALGIETQVVNAFQLYGHVESVTREVQRTGEVLTRANVVASAVPEWLPYRGNPGDVPTPLPVVAMGATPTVPAGVAPLQFALAEGHRPEGGAEIVSVRGGTDGTATLIGSGPLNGVTLHSDGTVSRQRSFTCAADTCTTSWTSQLQRVVLRQRFGVSWVMVNDSTAADLWGVYTAGTGTANTITLTIGDTGQPTWTWNTSITDAERREIRRQQLRARGDVVRQNHRGQMVRARDGRAFADARQEELVALTLLRQMFPDQFRRYLSHGFVTVQGSSGLTYQIFRERSARVQVWERGEKIAALCVHLRDPSIPPSDEVVAKAVIAEYDEKDLWARANVGWHTSRRDRPALHAIGRGGPDQLTTTTSRAEMIAQAYQRVGIMTADGQLRHRPGEILRGADGRLLNEVAPGIVDGVVARAG